MVQISHETPEEIQQRLLKVIAQSDFRVYDGTYTFEEFPLEQFPSAFNQQALAIVRDDMIWSQLVSSTDQSKDLFKIFSFHFDNCTDNSGFVGWLAIYLKNNLGTGVFVTCGQNTKRGGIFDYWGCPIEVAEEVIDVINDLIKKGNQLII